VLVLVLVVSEAVLVIEVDGPASSDSFAIPIAVARICARMRLAVETCR
jgi:hypothetical protein